MKRITLSVFWIALCLCAFSQGTNRPLTFAWLTDTHLNSFAYAEDDLRQAVEDINANPSVEFIILSGDATEFGDSKEFLLLDEILKGFRKPCLLTTGNHDVNWSENGCTVFNKIFGKPNFCHDVAGVRFIGCGSGPTLRMGPPHIPREEILWLDSIVAATPANTPIVFINHFPIDRDLSNWYEVIDILKTRNIQAILCGHGHGNDPYDFEGIPGVMGRSLLRRSDPIGGYNIVTMDKNTMKFQERTIKKETKPVWHEIELAPFDRSKDTKEYYRPDFGINDTFPNVKAKWQLKDITDVASQGEIDEDLFVYTNTAGVVHALDAATGDTRWTYTTRDKIFSAPYITDKDVIISSSDGCIYSLNKVNGTVNWKYDTQYPIVACPLVVGETIYIGSSNGKFYSLKLADGAVNWVCQGLEGYIESRPAVDDKHVYTGTWGAKFYAIHRETGEKVWEFDTRKGRYVSPGACWPVVINNQVIILSTDYFIRAFDPDTGNIIWESNEAKGRESIGISPDRKTLYIKGIQNNITAVDVSQREYHKIWNTLMPYRSNFIPTRMETTKDLVFIPTEFGVLHAVKADGSGIAWSHKVSHSAITSINNSDKNKVIIMTMDGTITCLKYQ